MKVGIAASVGVTLDAFFPEIAAAWRARGHSIHAIAGTAASAFDVDVETTITRSPSLRNVRAPRRIRRWSELRSLDVVLTNTATVSTLIRLARIECPVVYFCHGLHWNEETFSNWPIRCAEHMLLHATDGVVTINSSDESWFRAHASRVPNLRLTSGVGLDLERFPRSPRVEDSTLKLLWVGEFSERKRPIEALRVLALLRRDGLNAKLTMLGQGPLLTRAREVSDQLGLGDDVEFPGHRPTEPFLRESTAVIHTASWEGLPRVLLESLAVGRPVFAYDVKGVRDVPTAFLAQDAVPAALAALIGEFVSGENTWAPPDPRPLSNAAVAGQLETFMQEVAGGGR
jgi:glycosyltransferase involved in cell wall biosynthesis